MRIIILEPHNTVSIDGEKIEMTPEECVLPAAIKVLDFDTIKGRGSIEYHDAEKPHALILADEFQQYMPLVMLAQMRMKERALKAAAQQSAMLRAQGGADVPVSVPQPQASEASVARGVDVSSIEVASLRAEMAALRSEVRNAVAALAARDETIDAKITDMADMIVEAARAAKEGSHGSSAQ